MWWNFPVSREPWQLIMTSSFHLVNDTTIYSGKQPRNLSVLLCHKSPPRSPGSYPICFFSVTHMLQTCSCLQAFAFVFLYAWHTLLVYLHLYLAISFHCAQHILQNMRSPPLAGDTRLVTECKLQEQGPLCIPWNIAGAQYMLEWCLVIKSHQGRQSKLSPLHFHSLGGSHVTYLTSPSDGSVWWWK